MGTALRVEGTPPVALNGAMGDLPTAVTLVAGVLLALYRREREGQGAIVDVSLYQCGMWANGLVIAAALAGAAEAAQAGSANTRSVPSTRHTSARTAPGCNSRCFR